MTVTMTTNSSRPRILHIHSTFDAGGKEIRSTRLINAFAQTADHAIVSGDLERRSAAQFISRQAKVVWPVFPRLDGWPALSRLKKLAEAMRGYDLICTYNWGAMNAVMAHTLFADVCKLAPLVHHEDGFNEDEASKPKWSRNFFRRVAMGRTAALVVPSKELERIALKQWQQPRTRVQTIPNGIDTAAFGASPPRDGIPRLIKRKGENWVGTLAGLRKVKQLTALVQAFAALDESWQLVIAGEGPERDAILAEAEKCGIEDRVHLPGLVDKPWRVVGLFDIFALSSRSEQAPLSVVEAMAAGLPVAAPRLGEIGSMLSTENAALLSDPGDVEGLSNTLQLLAKDPVLRTRLGNANRARARDAFDEKRMIDRYRALYFGLIKPR